MLHKAYRRVILVSVMALLLGVVIAAPAQADTTVGEPECINRNTTYSGFFPADPDTIFDVSDLYPLVAIAWDCIHPSTGPGVPNVGHLAILRQDPRTGLTEIVHNVWYLVDRMGGPADFATKRSWGSIDIGFPDFTIPIYKISHPAATYDVTTPDIERYAGRWEWWTFGEPGVANGLVMYHGIDNVYGFSTGPNIVGGAPTGPGEWSGFALVDNMKQLNCARVREMGRTPTWCAP